MDPKNLDALVHPLAVGVSRRFALRAALAGLIAPFSTVDAAAKRARRRRKSNGLRGERLATAAAPSRVRELTCSDGTTFLGEQVRKGWGRPPHTWRNVDPGAYPVAFNFHAVTITGPDGAVIENSTFDNTQGVARNNVLITCTIFIPIGPLEGNTAEFVGFYLP